MHPYDYEVALWVKAAVQQIPFETDEARRGATESGACTNTCTTSQLDSARCCLAVNTLERHELSRHFTLLMKCPFPPFARVSHVQYMIT